MCNQCWCEHLYLQLILQFHCFPLEGQLLLQTTVWMSQTDCWVPKCIHCFWHLGARSAEFVEPLECSQSPVLCFITPYKATLIVYAENTSIYTALQFESRKYLHHRESTPGLNVLGYNYYDEAIYVLHVIVFILFAVRRTVITHLQICPVPTVPVGLCCSLDSATERNTVHLPISG